MKWLKWPLEHYPISLLIIGIFFVLGIFGMYDMPKDEFPHAIIRQGVVVAVYPGATTHIGTTAHDGHHLVAPFSAQATHVYHDVAHGGILGIAHHGHFVTNVERTEHAMPTAGFKNIQRVRVFPHVAQNH